MFDIVIHFVGEDNYIIRVNHARFQSKLGKYHVKCTLQSFRCLSQTKWHPQILIYTSVAKERGFITIYLSYIHLQIT